MESTAEIIKGIMEGYTIREVSEATGYHENTISQWRRGLNEPPFYAVVCVAEACGHVVEVKKTPTY